MDGSHEPSRWRRHAHALRVWHAPDGADEPREPREPRRGRRVRREPSGAPVLGALRWERARGSPGCNCGLEAVEMLR